MVLCTRCGAEEMDLPLTIAAPVNGYFKRKTEDKSCGHWSQVSQKVCPVCGAQHVNICCAPKAKVE